VAAGLRRPPPERRRRAQHERERQLAPKRVLTLDIGDRIRVLRTPPGGGPRIDQTLFVQSVRIDGANDGAPWRIRLGVSPL
jgi:hypothetical protein